MILKRKKERKTERTRKISRLSINHLLKQIRKKRVSLQIVLFRNFMQSICMQSAVCVWRALLKNSPATQWQTQNAHHQSLVTNVQAYTCLDFFSFSSLLLLFFFINTMQIFYRVFFFFQIKNASDFFFVQLNEDERKKRAKKRNRMIYVMEVISVK